MRSIISFLRVVSTNRLKLSQAYLWAQRKYVSWKLMSRVYRATTEIILRRDRFGASSPATAQIINYWAASHATSWPRRCLSGENRFIDSPSRHSEAYPTWIAATCNGRRKKYGLGTSSITGHTAMWKNLFSCLCSLLFFIGICHGIPAVFRCVPFIFYSYAFDKK